MQPDALASVVALAIKSAVAPLAARVAVLETQLAEARTALDVKDLHTRVAVLETRAPVPGPAGAAGVDGLAGKDGADGLGFDDLDIVHDGERGVIVRFARGERVKESTIVFPCLLYRGVFAPGHTYNAGDIVTHGGSAWHCGRPTTTKPDTAEGAAFWKLMVKRGDRGRDVREAPTPSIVRAMR
jgi:hypothetical protein